MKEFMIGWWEGGATLTPGFIIVKFGDTAKYVPVGASDKPRDVARMLEAVRIGGDTFFRSEPERAENGDWCYKVSGFDSEEFRVCFLGDAQTAEKLGIPEAEESDSETVTAAFNKRGSATATAFKLAFAGTPSGERKAQSLADVLLAADLLGEHSEASADACLIAAAVSMTAPNLPETDRERDDSG